MRLAVLSMLVLAKLSFSLPVLAQGATPCAAVAGDDASQRCRVVRNARAGTVRAAVLAVTTDRMEQFSLVVRGADGWRVVRTAASAYNFQDLRGAIAVQSFAVRDVIPGGAPELDLLVRRWQGQLAPADACSVERRDQLHRYVCTERDGAWACMGLQVEEAPARTVVVERPCTPPAAPAAAPWSVALRFTADTLHVEPRAGTLPPILEAWVGARPLAEVFAPAGQGLPSPPDTV